MENDLSRQVAEVVGWTCKEPEKGIYWDHPDKFSCFMCPDYANNMDLAMELVKEDGTWLELTTGELERDVCHVIVWIEFDSGQAEHKNPASAICLAWLEAKKAGLRALEGK
jgi:hypothetical protein